MKKPNNINPKESYIKIAKTKGIKRVQKYIMDELLKDGFTKSAAAALVGNLTHESGYFKSFLEGAPNRYNTRGMGILQWTDIPKRQDLRGTAFVNWMKKNKYDQKSLEGNVKYLIHEMKNGYYSGGAEGKGKKTKAYTDGLTYDKLKTIDNIDVANKSLLEGYIRPASKVITDSSGRSVKVHSGQGQRLGFAKTLYDTYEDIPGLNFSKEREKLKDNEAKKVFKDYKKQIEKIDKNLPVGEYDAERIRIQQNFVQKYGNDNLRKGAEAFNKEAKDKFFNENPELKKKDSLNFKRSKLIRDYDALLNPTKEQTEDFNEERLLLDQKLKAVDAQVIIKNYKKQSNELTKELKGLDVDSDEYKKLNQRKKSLENKIGKLDGIMNYPLGKTPVLDEQGRKIFLNAGSDEIVETIGPDKSRFIGADDKLGAENLQKEFDSLISQEKWIDLEDNYNNENTDSVIDSKYINEEFFKENNLFDEKDKEFIFSGDFIPPVPKRPEAFTEDIENQEKPSVKGFIEENPLALLNVALGIKGVVDSGTEIPDLSIEDNTQLSNAWYEHLDKLKRISKQGFTPEEEANYLKEINDGFVNSLEIATRASGGNRALLLAKTGELNANKNDALLNFSAADASLNRENIEKLGSALAYTESFNERKGVREQENDYREKNFEIQQALQKRESGAALAASSLQNLINSISDYKESGPGSVLQRANDLYLKRVEASLLGATPFKNKEEYDNFVKNQEKENSDFKSGTQLFQQKFNSLETSNDEKKKLFDVYEALGRKEKMGVQKTFDGSLQSLNDALYPTAKKPEVKEEVLPEEEAFNLNEFQGFLTRKGSKI